MSPLFLEASTTNPSVQIGSPASAPSETPANIANRPMAHQTPTNHGSGTWGVMKPHNYAPPPIPNAFSPGFFSARNRNAMPSGIFYPTPTASAPKKPPKRGAKVAPSPPFTSSTAPSTTPKLNRPHRDRNLHDSAAPPQSPLQTFTTLVITGLHPALAQARYAVIVESIIVDAIARAGLTDFADLNAVHVSIIGGRWARHVVDPSSSSCSMLIPLRITPKHLSCPASWYGTTLHELLSLPYSLPESASSRPSTSLLSLQLLTADEASILHTQSHPYVIARGISTKASTVSRQMLALREHICSVNPLAAANCAIVVVYIRHTVYLDPTSRTQSRRSEKCLAVYSLSPIARLPTETSLIRSRGFNLQLESSARRIASAPLALAASDPATRTVAMSKRKRREPHCALPTPCLNINSTSTRGPAILSALANAVPPANIADSYWSSPTTFTILLHNCEFPEQHVLQSALAHLGVSQVSTSDHAPGILGNHFVFPTITSFFSLTPPSVRHSTSPPPRNVPRQGPSPIVHVERDLPPLPSLRPQQPTNLQSEPVTAPGTWTRVVQTPNRPDNNRAACNLNVTPLPPDSATIASVEADIASIRQQLASMVKIVTDLTNLITIKPDQLKAHADQHVQLCIVVGHLLTLLSPTALTGPLPAEVLDFPRHVVSMYARDYATPSYLAAYTSDIAPMSNPLASKS